VRRTCEVLRVSRSGYYDWRRRQGTESKREAANRVLTDQIREAFEALDQTYGSPRVWRQLQEDGVDGRVRLVRRKQGSPADAKSRSEGDEARSSLAPNHCPESESANV